MPPFIGRQFVEQTETCLSFDEHMDIRGNQIHFNGRDGLPGTQPIGFCRAVCSLGLAEPLASVAAAESNTGRSQLPAKEPAP